MLYVDPALIGAALGGRALPFVGDPVFNDPPLCTILDDAFADFPEPIEDLAIPGLIAALADALARRAGSPSVMRRLPEKALKTARRLLGDAAGPLSAAMLEKRPASTASPSPVASATGSAPRRTATSSTVALSA